MNFQELLKAAKFDRVISIFEDDGRWPDLGDHVRGEFVVLDLSNYFDNLDIEIAMCQLNLQPATAYELVYYASHGWSGTESILAFGSVYDKHIPWLKADEGLPDYDRRELSCAHFDGPWPNAAVLCVRII